MTNTKKTLSVPLIAEIYNIVKLYSNKFAYGKIGTNPHYTVYEDQKFRLSCVCTSSKLDRPKTKIYQMLKKQYQCPGTKTTSSKIISDLQPSSGRDCRTGRRPGRSPHHRDQWSERGCGAARENRQPTRDICRRGLKFVPKVSLTPVAACSVTRFGKISPLWQNFTSLWTNFDGSFLIWQNIKPILANLLHCWANFHCCKTAQY